MNIIEKIVTNKRKTIQKQKQKKSLNDIKKDAKNHVSTQSKQFRFEERLKDKKSTKLIAEYKPASPSQGTISTLQPEDIIPLYDSNPVDMISVLTEESYFKSNLSNFKKANKLTKKPLLRKDFIIDEYMIYEAALNNASCILLINGVCPNIEKYIQITEELGLDAIIECHSKKDIIEIADLNPKIIGINNRNLSTLTVDLDTTRKLKEYVPNYLISESGVQSTGDATLLKNYGADAILIGTSILKERNEEKIGEYLNKLSKALKK